MFLAVACIVAFLAGPDGVIPTVGAMGGKLVGTSGKGEYFFDVVVHFHAPSLPERPNIKKSGQGAPQLGSSALQPRKGETSTAITRLSCTRPAINHPPNKKPGQGAGSSRAFLLLTSPCESVRGIDSDRKATPRGINTRKNRSFFRKSQELTRCDEFLTMKRPALGRSVRSRRENAPPSTSPRTVSPLHGGDIVQR